MNQVERILPTGIMPKGQNLHASEILALCSKAQAVSPDSTELHNTVYPLPLPSFFLCPSLQQKPQHNEGRSYYGSDLHARLFCQWRIQKAHPGQRNECDGHVAGASVSA